MRPQASSATPESSVPWAAGLIVLFGLAAYINSLSGPFVFDDLPSIVSNPTLRALWPPGSVLHPPAASTVSGRPLLNLSFALNHEIGGEDVRGYHALNLLVHLLGGLTLFGWLRRTFLRVRFAGGIPGAQTWAAFAAALVWTVHPLQTESVTYIAQRAESLMGLLYLFTFYAFVRAMDAPPASAAAPWLAISVVACAAGMAVKEVMVTAPVLVILYDRTFIAGSLREALRRRWLYYAGLAAGWALLAWLMAGVGGNRNGSIGFGIGIKWWAYALTQLIAIPRYLGLSLWPHPLIFEYGPFEVTRFPEALPGAILVGGLAAATLLATWKRFPAGFWGCWFFAILAPTSSIVPGATQRIVEHRMYLPLAAVVVLTSRLLFVLLERVRLFLLFILVAALGLALATARRNRDYHSEIALWQDTVVKRPMNPNAHDNLGAALVRTGKWPEAAAQFEEALQLRANDPEAHNQLGTLLARAGRLPEAIVHFKEAVRQSPGYADAHLNLGSALAQSGRIPEAAEEFATAIRLQPGDAEALNELGTALAQMGQFEQAVVQFQAAVRLRPAFAQGHYNLGVTLAQLGRKGEAVHELEEVLRLQPSDGRAREILSELEPAGVKSP